MYNTLKTIEIIMEDQKRTETKMFQQALNQIANPHLQQLGMGRAQSKSLAMVFPTLLQWAPWLYRLEMKGPVQDN